MSIDKRLKENRGILTEEQQTILQDVRVLLVGCGGIGGNVANQLIRLGVRHLTLVDHDRFEESNLNRQLFSTIETLGRPKATVVSEELLRMDPTLDLVPYIDQIEHLSNNLFPPCDVVIDAVDQPTTKVYLNKQATNYGKPLLHGACAGWYGQVGWLEPGCLLLEELYKDNQSGLESNLRNPSFTPAFTASIMVAEFVKYMVKSSQTTVNNLVLLDAYNNTMSTTKARNFNG